MSEHDDPRHIGILLFDDVEELDAIGPYEVLAWWTQYYPEDGYAVHTFSRGDRLVRCAKGLTVQAGHDASSAPAPEVLIHPGGRGADTLATDAGHLDWLRAQRASVPLLVSVCTGALTLAAAGLLRERTVTTHHRALDALRAAEPSATVRDDVRYVDDGDLLTAAGVSAGIDMALHLISRLTSPERAEQVRAGIEYAPGAQMAYGHTVSA